MNAGPHPTGDDRTDEVYDTRAAQWEAARRPGHDAGARGARTLAAAAEVVARGDTGSPAPGDDPASRPLVDLGCGPGWHTAALGTGAVALDRSAAMLALAPTHAPHAHRVQADLRALPLATGTLGGAWASRSYVHLRRSEVPAALADLHRALAPGAPVELVLFDGDAEHQPWPDDDFPGRRFSLWPADLLEAVVTGAGFTIAEWHTEGTGRGAHHCILAARADTLPDMTGAGMGLLVVGLNPSLHAARAGVGYVGPGNRFWPAALEAGLASRSADPAHALRHHGMGMTDLVKRATPDAAVLSPDEYRRGRDRLARLVAWLQPGALCVVGLAGWRAAVDRRAAPGPQTAPFAGVPVYLLASTSGRNARWRHQDFVAHLRAAARLAAGEDPEPPPLPVGTGRSAGPTDRGRLRSPVR